MSLLESLNDKSRHSKQPASFAAVQTTWSSGNVPPPKANSREKKTIKKVNKNVNELNSDTVENKFLQEEMLRLENKISKVASSIGTLYNQLNIFIEKQKEDERRKNNNNLKKSDNINSGNYKKNEIDNANDLNNIASKLGEIIDSVNSYKTNTWRDVSYFMMGVSTISILSSMFVIYTNRKQ
jgi:ABC-type antimicrobial peptide transport system permease subunit